MNTHTLAGGEWDETTRLTALREQDILDTPPEQGFDDIVMLAAGICETPMSLVSFVAEDRQWFKARLGIDRSETPLNESVCVHGIRQENMLIIPDLSADPRTRDNPLVRGKPGIRFYAGARLDTHETLPLGMLCVIDTQPRSAGLTEAQQAALQALARQVTSQMELRASRGRLAKLFEQTTYFLAMLRGPTHRIELANPGYVRLLGGQAVVGKTVAEVLPDLARRGHLAALDTVYRTGETYTAAKLRYRMPARPGIPHEERLLDLVYQPVFDNARNVIGIMVEGTDVTERASSEKALRDHNQALTEQVRGEATERAKLEETLRHAQKMEAVGQLTGGLAHDFNNLLAGISGSLEMIATRLAQGRTGEVERHVLAAQGAARRVAALTHRLLAFSRRQTLDPRPTNVNRLVMDMEELVRRAIGPSIALEVVTAGGLWTTLIDPGQLENALLNLCVNARDAMPDGGKLIIETANKWLDATAARQRDVPPGQYITVCVSDNGTGMTAEVVTRAFDPFYTTKPLGLGTGLGLSMVYGFARQSGGQTRIYSEPGEGTMICLYLPRHHGEAGLEGGSDMHTNAIPSAASGKTVLVVDDEPLIRMLVVEVLEDSGYTVIEGGDAAEGLRTLNSAAQIDLLVTDVGLPGGMNGRQMADAARATRPDLTVLFITGYAENAAIGHGRLDPGMHVLTKPFGMEDLARKVADLLSRQDGTAG